MDGMFTYPSKPKQLYLSPISGGGGGGGNRDNLCSFRLFLSHLVFSSSRLCSFRFSMFAASVWLEMTHLMSFYPKGVNLSLFQKRSPTGLVVDDLHGCGSDIFFMALALGNTNLSLWKLDSPLKLSCCIYSGFQLVISFFLQAWVVSQKGPLCSALFNPLAAVIVTFFGALYLKEQTYLGSLLGALAIILGLYIVLWGKSEDYQEESTVLKLDNEHTTSNLTFPL